MRTRPRCWRRRRSCSGSAREARSEPQASGVRRPEARSEPQANGARRLAMRVFVTGATGFIGGAIVRQLVPNHTLLAMSRSAAGDDAVHKLVAEPVRCDLLTLAPGQIPPCDVVVHCA